MATRSNAHPGSGDRLLALRARAQARLRRRGSCPPRARSVIVDLGHVDRRSGVIRRPSSGGCRGRAGASRRHADRLLARARQRVARLRRRPQLPEQSPLSRARPGPAPLHVHRVDHGALDAGHLADPRPGLRAVGHEPARLPPRQPPAPRGQRRRLLRHRPAAARRGAAHGRRLGPASRRRHRGRALRAAPAARRVGGVDHRTARRALRVVLPARSAHVSEGRDARRRTTAPLVLRLDRALRAGAALEVDAGLAAVRPAGARRVSTAAAGRPGVALGHGPHAGRGEAALSRARGGRRRLDERRDVRRRARDAAVALPAGGARGDGRL